MSVSGRQRGSHPGAVAMMLAGAILVLVILVLF
jgi:hypothetical protein